MTPHMFYENKYIQFCNFSLVHTLNSDAYNLILKMEANFRDHTEGNTKPNTDISNYLKTVITKPLLAKAKPSEFTLNI